MFYDYGGDNDGGLHDNDQIPPAPTPSPSPSPTPTPTPGG